MEPGGDDPNAPTVTWSYADTFARIRAQLRYSQPRPLLLPGVFVSDRYRVYRLIAHGGFGDVYEADGPSNESIALKWIPFGPNGDRSQAELLSHEAQAQRLLAGPGILPVIDQGVDEVEAGAYLILPLCEMSFNRWTNRGNPTRDIGLHVLNYISSSIELIHENGYVHRDVKPSNILVDARGKFYIADFGLAIRAGEGIGLQGGTPGYMSPEQIRGDAVSPASDVFSLGVMLYEILAGRRPFRGAGVQEVLRRTLSESPTAPAEIDPTVPGDLEAICLRCLEFDPSKRYPSAGDLAAELAAARQIARPGLWSWLRGLLHADRENAHRARVVEDLQRSIAVSRSQGIAEAEGRALSQLGEVYAAAGDLARAASFQEQAAELFRSIGDRRGEAGATWERGRLLFAQGQTQLAIASAEVALRIYEEIDRASAEIIRTHIEEWRRVA
jgi:serine/threonine-protein kinase